MDTKPSDDRRYWMLKHKGLTEEFKNRVRAAAEAEGKYTYDWIYDVLEEALRQKGK
jgi:hypothetical protein